MNTCTLNDNLVDNLTDLIGQMIFNALYRSFEKFKGGFTSESCWPELCNNGTSVPGDCVTMRHCVEVVYYYDTKCFAAACLIG